MTTARAASGSTPARPGITRGAAGLRAGRGGLFLLALLAGGRAPAFRVLIHSPGAVVSSSGGQDTPRSGQRRCSPADHRPAWLICDE
jgi:hypothetical protein